MTSKSFCTRTSRAGIPRSTIKPVPAPVPVIINKPIRLKPDDIQMDEVWRMLDKKSLFKLSWGFRGRAGTTSEVDPERLLETWKVRVVDEGLFEPEAVYGYFRCHSKGETLVVEGPSGDVEFDFPRSAQPKHLCLADYFGDDDVVAFQSVTIGSRVSEVVDLWNQQDMYTDAYYLHGLAVRLPRRLPAGSTKR